MVVVAFYAGLGLVMITGIMAIVEMSMGFEVQQSRGEPNNIYSKISPSAAAFDRDWLQVLDSINNVNVNDLGMENLLLWGQKGSSLRSCTCYLLERSAFSRDKEKLNEDQCLFGHDGDSNTLFPSDSIAEEIAKKIDPLLQSEFISESLPSPTSSFLTSCDFKRLVNTSINGINVEVKHRVLIFPDRSSKTLKLYSCAFDNNDPNQKECSFEKN